MTVYALSVIYLASTVAASLTVVSIALAYRHRHRARMARAASTLLEVAEELDTRSEPYLACVLRDLADTISPQTDRSNRKGTPMFIIHKILQALSVRRCEGCADESPHSHHLTKIGHWRYVDRFSK